MRDELLYEVRNGAAWLTINREARPEQAYADLLKRITAFMEKRHPQFK